MDWPLRLCAGHLGFDFRERISCIGIPQGFSLGEIDFIKNVTIVDEDIDRFDEKEVVWSVATSLQADEDADIIKNIKGNVLDSSLKGDILTVKMLIDATRPFERPFAARIQVPADALDRARLLLEQRYIIQEQWKGRGTGYGSYIQCGLPTLWP